MKQAVFAAIRCGIAVSPVIGGGIIDIEAGKEEAFGMIAPLLSAKDMSDRAFALRNAVELGGAKGAAAHADAREEWTKHTIGCEQYISCMGQVDSDEAPGLIRKLIKVRRSEERSECGERSDPNEDYMARSPPDASVCNKTTPLTCRFAPRLTRFAIRCANRRNPSSRWRLLGTRVPFHARGAPTPREPC